MATNKQIFDKAKEMAGNKRLTVDDLKKAKIALMNKGNPKEAGGSTTTKPFLSDSLLNLLTPELGERPNEVKEGKPRKRFKVFPSIGAAGVGKPKLQKEVAIPDEPVQKGKKPNMGQVAGGFKTLNVAKGGMVRKKSAKKSKKAGRAAKRGYGMAKRGK